MFDNLLDDDESFFYEEDKLGMTTTSGIVKIKKDKSNLIGISIGGGSPNCPCTYIIQVFDNTPTSKEGVLEAGDEIVAINGESVKGKTKKDVAKMIQSSEKEVTIKYNKLHLQGKKGKNLDIILKKVKHRFVESMSSATADALGLSRAVLLNDSLAKKLEKLEKIEYLYQGLVEHLRHLVKMYLEVFYIYKDFGNVFSEIGVKEQQPQVCSAFSKFGESHNQIEKKGIQMIKNIRPVLMDLCTFLYKVLPDTKLTVKKYADIKFEYLSYCLKVKEMDDEEVAFQAMQEPLYRVESGNYEYRLILRCRQEANIKFAKMRSDVSIKLELLDQKHTQNLAEQLQKLMKELKKFYEESHSILSSNKLFPIEIDLPKTSLNLELNLPLESIFTDDNEKKNDKDEDLIEPELLAEFNEFNLNSLDSNSKILANINFN